MTIGCGRCAIALDILTSRRLDRLTVMVVASFFVVVLLWLPSALFDMQLLATRSYYGGPRNIAQDSLVILHSSLS